MTDKRKGLFADRECASATCNHRATCLACPENSYQLPEAYCFDCLRVLSGDNVKLRTGGRLRSMLWRIWDENRAHHHTGSAFVLAGLALSTGQLSGWESWLVLALLAIAAVADMVAMNRLTYRLWPLSIPPLALSMTVPALFGNHWVSMLAVVLALFHATLLVLAWHDSFAEQFNPGPPRPGSPRK